MFLYHTEPSAVGIVSRRGTDTSVWAAHELSEHTCARGVKELCEALGVPLGGTMGSPRRCAGLGRAPLVWHLKVDSVVKALGGNSSAKCP